MNQRKGGHCPQSIRAVPTRYSPVVAEGYALPFDFHPLRGALLRLTAAVLGPEEQKGNHQVLLPSFLLNSASGTGLALQTGQALRWEPLTILFVLASAWWVKWPLLVAVGACGDARCRRRLPPCPCSRGLLAVGSSGGSDECSQGVCSIAFGRHSPTRRSRRWCRRRSRRRSPRGTRPPRSLPRLRWARSIHVSGGRCSVWPCWSAFRESTSESTTCWMSLLVRRSGWRSASLMVWATRRLLGWLGRSGMSLRGVGTSFAPSRRLQESAPRPTRMPACQRLV